MRWPSTARAAAALTVGIACQGQPTAIGPAASVRSGSSQDVDREPVDVPHHADVVAQARRRAHKTETVARHNSRSAIAFSRAASEYIGLARLTGDDADYAKAEDMIEAAFEMRNALPPYLLRGRLNYTLHRLDLAEADLAEHAALPKLREQQDGAELLLVADLALQRGRYGEAEQAYASALAAEETKAALASMAYYRWRTGDFDRAEALYRRVLSRLGPEALELAAWTHVQLGLMDLERGRYDEALAHYLDGEKHMRGFWLVDEHIAEVTGLLGRTAAARQMYTAILERTSNPEFMDAMATILRDEGDDAGAKSYVALARAAHDERLRRYPEAGYGHALEHHLEFGEPERAVELAEKNRALRPNAESEICLARAYLGVARIGDAKRSIEAALATPLRMAKLHATAAAVYAAAGDVDGARSQAAKAAAINPKVALESVAE